MRKYLWAILVLFLAACGSSTSTKEKPKEEPKQTQDKEDVVEEKPADEAPAEVDEEESGEWEEADFGKVKIVGVGINEEIGMDGTETEGTPIEFGPMKLQLSELAVLEIEPTGDAAELYFEDKEKVKAVLMDMKVENTSEDDITFNPNFSEIVTNTGEQVESDIILSGDPGGDFLGKVTKEGQAWWILKDPDAEITSIKIIINPPYGTDDFEEVGEEKRIEIEVIGFEEAKKKEGS